MAFKLPTMSREASSSTSTGDMVMAGAQTGYFAFSAGLSNGDTTFLTFKMGSDEETGKYTYNSGANSFTRTQIYRSTNANAAVNWSAGTKDVICALPGPSDLDAAGRGLLQSLLTSGVNAQTADYTVIQSDCERYISGTGSHTLTLTAPGTLGSGFEFEFGNDGTGKWVVSPASGLINGVASINLYPNERCRIVCDGSNFRTIGLASSVLLDTQTASSSATLDFVNFLDGYFDEYEFRITSIIPATDITDAWFRVSLDGGSTYRATASDYRWAQRLDVDGAAGVNTGSTTDTKVVLATILSSNTARAFSGSLRISDIASSTRFKNIGWTVENYDSTPQVCTRRGSAILAGATSAINAARFLISSGNVASGTIRLYGIRK